MQSHLWLFLFITSACVILTAMKTPSILQEITWVLTSLNWILFRECTWAPPQKDFLLDPGPAFPALEPDPAWRPTSLKPHSELYVPWILYIIMSDTTERREQGFPSKSFTVAISGNGHKAAGFSQTQLWLPGKWKFLRVLIQGCNLMWNVPERTPKSFCVFPVYYFLN